MKLFYIILDLLLLQKKNYFNKALKNTPQGFILLIIVMRKWNA